MSEFRIINADTGKVFLFEYDVESAGSDYFEEAGIAWANTIGSADVPDRVLVGVTSTDVRRYAVVKLYTNTVTGKRLN